MKVNMKLVNQIPSGYRGEKLYMMHLAVLEGGRPWILSGLLSDIPDETDPAIPL
jgi:hypothetical protein